MATSLKRRADEGGPAKVPRVVQRVPLPDPQELAMSSRKLLIALTIHPKRPVDNIWDALPEMIQSTCLQKAHDMRVWEHERAYGFSKVLAAMMSFGKCTCTNRPDCEEHHPRNVMINWRYKVGVFFCFAKKKNVILFFWKNSAMCCGKS